MKLIINFSLFVKTSLIFTFMFFSLYSAFSQGAAVNTSGSAADPSAMLDVSSNNSGMLIPRMTTVERDLINSPAQGLQIYNTTTRCFEFFEYGMWQALHCAVCPLPGNAGIIIGSSSVCQGDNSVVFSVPTIANATSYIWAYTGSGTTINGSGNSVNLNFAGNATSGNLTVKGNNQCGDGAASPAFSIDVNGIPSAPVTAIHSSAQTSIIWNWNAVSGATGYKYNSVNDYVTATDAGTNTTYSQAGLICNTAYNLYVWAYNNCGVSVTTVLNASTVQCLSNACGVITFLYNGSNITYGTVINPTTGKCWLDRNLGATDVATAYNDINAYGDYFQWGRADDGHQIMTSGTTTTLSSSDNPGHSLFIMISPDQAPRDWRSPQNNNLWQGVSGVNNPCPTGWRLPTSTELNDERNSWSQANYIGAFNSPLKLTAAGCRDRVSGNPKNIGTFGYYSSSNVSTTWAVYLRYTNSIATTGEFNRADGMSVRCIKN